ncbi:MAG: hypothetical protein B7733_09390 [Myxococcales bacterium FL481]|nr:MAG: hypothetical protein B7733_09390 [Myxococcales bacterium FL481]
MCNNELVTRFDGVQVFSTTRELGSGHLGDRVTAWRREHPNLRPLEVNVRQSSDSSRHCLTIVVWWEHAH